MLPSLSNRSPLFKIAVAAISIQLLRMSFFAALLATDHLGQSARAARNQALLYAQPEMIFTLLATVLVSVLFVAKETQRRFMAITSASVLTASVLGALVVSDEVARALEEALPFPVLTFVGLRGPSQMILCGVAFAFGALASVRFLAHGLPWMLIFGFAAILGIGVGSLMVSMNSIVGGSVFHAAIVLSSLPFALACGCLVVWYQGRCARSAAPPAAALRTV